MPVSLSVFPLLCSLTRTVRLVAFSVSALCTSQLAANVAYSSGVGESILSQYSRLAEAADTARRDIDRSEFDLEALVDSLDYESDAIIDFVREQVVFEQYPGVLRGPLGTLWSRAGNSADQALLLAKLLKDAGYDARIARGTLRESQARLLFHGMQPRTAATAQKLPPSVIEYLQATGVYDHLNPEVSEALRKPMAGPRGNQELTDSVDKQLTMIGALLPALPDNARANHTDELVKEARDYFWVQFRESAANDWSDIHPATDRIRDAVPESYFADSVPDSLLHRFRFEVFIESLVGDRLETRPVGVAWERPTANLNGVPLTFTNVPSAMLAAPTLYYNPETVIEDSNWYVPTFNGSLAPGAQYFDRRGNGVDPGAAGSAAAGVFETMGALFAEATEEIGPGNLPELTAQWLQFTLISPDGTERTYRRYVFDRVGAARRRDGALPDRSTFTAADLRPLLQSHSIMLTNGGTPLSLSMDRSLARISEVAPLFSVLAKEIDGQTLSAESMAASLRDIPDDWTGHVSLLTNMDLALQTGTHVSYRPAPMLVVHRQGLAGTDEFVEAIDIVQNPRRAFSRNEAGNLIPNMEIVREAGVWETELEGALLQPGGARVNTKALFESAFADEKTAQLVRLEAELGNLSLHENTKAAMAEDLTNGAWLIIVEHEQPGAGAWWRINPLTGETIGQIDDGRGSVASEYIQGVALGISICMAAISIINCANDYKPANLAAVEREQIELACCGLVSTMYVVNGYLIGALSSNAGMLYDAATSWSPNVCEF